MRATPSVEAHMLYRIGIHIAIVMDGIAHAPDRGGGLLLCLGRPCGQAQQGRQHASGDTDQAAVTALQE